jgi:putative heme-binding domain-containing protein
MLKRIVVMALAGLLWTTLVHAQGHGYTPADIENGGQLYQANCTACHGPDGDGVPSVNLGGGQFRRGTTDDELVKIILGGVPGTAMPPSSFSEGQAGTIVAYLRSLAGTTSKNTIIPGNAARGQALFTGKGQCQTCHSVAGVGSRTGPSLSEVGASRRAVELHRSLVDPSAEIRSDQRPVRMTMRDGSTITGRLMNQDTFSVQVLDANARLRLFDKDAVRELTILKESPMPSYRDTLDTQELADLVTYLTTLKGRR